MTLAKTYAISLIGLNGEVIEVEADISSNLPSFVLVGLPDASLSEATARVRSACQNSGLTLPARKITVNLSPASIPKYGSTFDLAIAIAILAASGQVLAGSNQGCVFIGELGLDGTLRPVNGVLPATLAAKHCGFERIVVPLAKYAEASLVSGIQVIACENLVEVVDILNGSRKVRAEATIAGTKPLAVEQSDLADVVGQPEAVEALIVAAAGGHHISMVGTPGSGKTMLAERLAGLLPDLQLDSAIEVEAIRSLVGQSTSAEAISLRPAFQAPHHTASMASIIGGGTGIPKPGAISLAHRGVLFLDELLEFQNHVVQSLREPLESRQITISRSAGQAVFPAAFQMIVAANPCPCGNLGAVKIQCTCTTLARQRYASKLSGPIFDRIDIRLQIQPVTSAVLRLESQLQSQINTATARARVEAARLSAMERLKGTRFESNAQVSSSYLRTKLKLPVAVTRDLSKALESHRISMRGFDRCLRLAWTISDLASSNSPSAEHVAMALSLRGTDLRSAR